MDVVASVSSVAVAVAVAVGVEVGVEVGVKETSIISFGLGHLHNVTGQSPESFLFCITEKRYSTLSYLSNKYFCLYVVDFSASN